MVLVLFPVFTFRIGNRFLLLLNNGILQIDQLGPLLLLSVVVVGETLPKMSHI